MYQVIKFQVFRSNINNMHTVMWLSIFQAIIWFKVNNNNNNNNYAT